MSGPGTISDGLFALRLRLATGGPHVLIWGGDRADLAAALADELDVSDLPAAVARVSAADDVIAALAERAGSIALLIVEGEAASGEAFWRALDGGRSRLQRKQPWVLLLTAPQAEALGRFGPNLKSWIGGASWRYRPDVLADDERERWLERLRARFGFGDDALIAQVAAGQAPADPEISEWLVLLGRGDLIGSGAET